VGFQLYADMLKSAVSALKAGREPDLAEPLGVTTEINLHVPARLPETYCNDVHERLVLYKRLASAETDADLDLLREELVDRFGPTPPPVLALLACHRLRLIAKANGVIKIDARPERASLQFVKEPPFDPASFVQLIARDGRIRFAGPNRIRIECAAPLLADRVALVRDFLLRLTPAPVSQIA
jgi:transcription-repair coupling factor (superfamily II helicase)